MSKNATRSSLPAKRQEGDLGRMAHYYDLVMVLLTLGRERKLRQMTLDLTKIKSGDKVLEIGCGTGTLTMAIRARIGANGEAVGIDIAPEMVKVATHKAARKGVDVSFQVGSIENIPSPDDRFDAAIFSFMIFHMPEDARRKGFAEILRVLKSGGNLFIIDTADLEDLPPILKDNSFIEITVDDFKLNFMRIRFLRGTARKS